MNPEHDRTLKILTEREMELAKAAEDKKLLAAKIDKLVGDLNTERAARDDGREGFSALKKEMDDSSRAMNAEEKKKKFGYLRWGNFVRDKARAEQHINDLTAVIWKCKLAQTPRSSVRRGPITTISTGQNFWELSLSRPVGLLRAPVKPVQLGQQTTRSLSCVDFWDFWKRETPWSQTRDSQFSSPE
jgi:hypothetical protein